MKWTLIFGSMQGKMGAYQKGDSKQMVAPLCAACEQCGKWRGVEDGAVKL